MMNIDDIFNSTVSRLSAAGILSPRLETRLLIAYVLGADASGILPHRIELGAGEAERLEVAVAERIQHKPLCKIIGSKAFYKHDFMVSCDVLSPRPDTEILVEAAVQIAPRKKMRQVLRLPHFCRKICEIPQRFYSSSRISAATSARSRRVSMAVFSIMRWASASLMPLCSIR